MAGNKFTDERLEELEALGLDIDPVSLDNVDEDDLDPIEEYLGSDLTIETALELVRKQMPNGYVISKKYREGLFLYLFVLKKKGSADLLATVIKPAGQVDIGDLPEGMRDDEDDE